MKLKIILSKNCFKFFRKSFLFIFIILVINFATFSETIIKSYQSIKYDDKGQIFGVDEITQEQFEKNIIVKSLYRFIYEDEKLSFIKGLKYIEGGQKFIEIKYKDEGKEITVAFYDNSTEFVMHENEASIYKFYYDKDGKCVKEEYYDNNGNFCLNLEGYAICVREYNQNGTCNKIMYFDQSGEMIVPKNIGFAAFTISYKDNKKTKMFLDQNLEYVKQKAGYIFITETFDEKNNLIKIEYFDETLNYCLYNNQYSYIIYEYDQNNNCTREAYFDEDSKPCKVNENFEIQTKFNKDNRIIERKYITDVE